MTMSRGWVGGPAPRAGKIAVLVTTLDERAYPAEALARLYRERADTEPSAAQPPA